MSDHRDADPIERLDVPKLWDEPYGSGIYRRRILVVNRSGSLAVGELEDDFHHFRIEIRHDGTTIQSADATPLRGPWSSCMTADVPIRAVEGQPLTASPSTFGGYTDPRMNCTHLFDVTGLTVAHATRPMERRDYRFEVTDRVGADQEHRATAWRDGEQVLEWTLAERRITAPNEWVGVDLDRKFIPWAEETLDPDAAEVAVALRRIIGISMGRMMDLDTFAVAADVGGGDGGMMANGPCMTYQPGVGNLAIRRKGTGRDFTSHPETQLADFDTRLP